MVALGIKEVFYSGGEPTLHPDFKKILDYTLEKGISFAVSSNATFGSDLVERMGQAKYLNLSLWADSEEKYEEIQGPRDFFQTVTSNIEELSKRTYVKVLFTIIPENIDCIFSTARLAKSLGAKKFTARRAYTSKYDALFTQEDLGRIKEEMERAFALAGSNFTVQDIIYKISYGDPVGITSCKHIFDNLVIGCDGELYPCSYLYYMPKYSLGKIEKGLKSGCEGPARTKFLSSFSCDWKVCTLPRQVGGE
jgi:MoaA/NifB/PqqE/SkfB family radical SAM enzyme